jgi:hypothetical protein
LVIIKHLKKLPLFCFDGVGKATRDAAFKDFIPTLFLKDRIKTKKGQYGLERTMPCLSRILPFTAAYIKSRSLLKTDPF